MTDIPRTITYDVDQSSINKAKQELEKLSKKEAELASSILKSDSASEEQLKALRKVQKEQRDLASVLRVVDTSFGKQEKAIEQATSALEQYEDRLRSVQQGGADLSGDFASSFGGLRGAGDALTGGNFGGAGKGLEIAEAFADLGEFVPRLKVQAEVLGSAIQASGSAASKLASNAGNAIAGLTGVNAGIATIGVTAVPVVAAIAAVTFAIYEFNKGMEAQRAVVEANVNALIDTNRQIAEGLTQDEAETEIARLEKLREADAKSLEFLNEQYQFFLDSFAELPPVIRDVATFITQQFVGTEQELVDGIKELESSTASYDASINILEQSMEDGSLVANDMAAAESELSRQREADIQRMQASMAQAQARAGQLQSQYDDIVENTAIANKNAAELEKAQAQIDRENAAMAEKKHQQSLERIRTEGQKRIQAIEAELSSLPAKRAEDLAKAEQKGNKDLDKLRNEYQQSTIQKYQDFEKDLSRTTTDAGKSIARLARDIKQSLTDATLENDVAAFLKAQRDGETRLQDAREDAQTQQQRMVDDFLKAQERERAAYMEKQSAIQQAIRDEQTQIMQAYAERSMALDAQRKAEFQAIEDRLAQERASHAEQLEAARIRAEQQSRLDTIRERQQLEAHNRQLQAIEAEKQAQLAAHNEIISSIRQMAVAAASIQAGASARRRDEPVFGGASSRNSGGNIFTRSTNTINNNFAVGDIATKKQVEDAVRGVVQETRKTFAGTFQKATSGRDIRR